MGQPLAEPPKAGTKNCSAPGKLKPLSTHIPAILGMRHSTSQRQTKDVLLTLPEWAKGCARGQVRCLWQRAGLSLPLRSDALTPDRPSSSSASLLLVFAADASCLFKKAPGQNRTWDA